MRQHLFEVENQTHMLPKLWPLSCFETKAKTTFKPPPMSTPTSLQNYMPALTEHLTDRITLFCEQL